MGNSIVIRLENSMRSVLFFKEGVFIKSVNIKDELEKRLFLVEIMEMGANQTRLAKAIGISRQTLHNYREAKKQLGLEGLISDQGSKRPKPESKSNDPKTSNRKSDLLRERRKAEKEKTRENQNGNRQIVIDFNAEHKTDDPKEVAEDKQPFSDEHDWRESRYAGSAVYYPILFGRNGWLDLIQDIYGDYYRIFLVFLFMSATNTRSIEQLKNCRLDEAGVVLGLDDLPSRPTIWLWFYLAADQLLSRRLKKKLFDFQFATGLISDWIWFVDGHLPPYSGKHKVRFAYNTQRRMPVPGQTKMVTSDLNGMVVDFEIQEGKGDLRRHIVDVATKWRDSHGVTPLMVFDREGTGNEFFYGLVEKHKIPFVTWEKNVDSKKLAELPEDKFDIVFWKNGKEYRAFEEKKTCRCVFEDKKKNDGDKVSKFDLRHIHLWNCTSRRRICVIAWTGDKPMTTEDCAEAILSRWGASENVFKHVQSRHPFHYHPGFGLEKSGDQLVSNPKLKKKAKKISSLKHGILKLRAKLSKTENVVKNDGESRSNSAYRKLESEIVNKENDLLVELKEKAELPDKIDVSSLEDYGCVNEISNEGKNMFDIVTSSVWNARQQMVNWLFPYFRNENEVVDLFYAVGNCHGWIKVTSDEVRIRLEPVQQPKRRSAQEGLCRKLTSINAQTPSGKFITIEVGTNPKQQ